MASRARSGPPRAKGPPPPQLKLARSLAHNKKSVRDKAVRSVALWVSRQNDVSLSDMLKLWKGLFYCVWMSDKPLVQRELCKRLAEVTLSLSSRERALMYVRAFFETIAREWDGIDHLRLDKFMTLVRLFVRSTFTYLRNQQWDEELIQKFAKLFSSGPMTVSNRVSLGLLMHMIDLYTPELVRVADGGHKRRQKPTFAQSQLLLSPLYEISRLTSDRAIRKRMRENAYDALLTAESQDTLSLKGHLNEVAAHLLSLVQLESTPMSTMGSLNNIIELFREEHEGNAMIDDLPEDEEKDSDDTPSSDESKLEETTSQIQTTAAASPPTADEQPQPSTATSSQKKKKRSKKRKRSAAATANGVESHEDKKQKRDSTSNGAATDTSKPAAAPEAPNSGTDGASSSSTGTPSKKKSSTPNSKKKKKSAAAKQKQPSMDNVMATLIADLASPASQQTIFGAAVAEGGATPPPAAAKFPKKTKKKNSLFSADEVEEFASLGSNEKVSSSSKAASSEWKSLADGLLPLGQSLADAESEVSGSAAAPAAFPSPPPSSAAGGSSSRRKKKTPKRVAQGLGSSTTPAAKSPKRARNPTPAAPSSAPTAKSRKNAPAAPSARSGGSKTPTLKTPPLPNAPERSALKMPGAPATPAELKKSVSFSRSIAHVREFSKKQSPSRLLSTPTTVYQLPSPTGGSGGGKKAKKTRQQQDGAADFAVPQQRAGRSGNRRASLRAKPRRKSTPMPQRRKSARRSTPRKMNI